MGLVGCIWGRSRKLFPWGPEPPILCSADCKSEVGHLLGVMVSNKHDQVSGNQTQVGAAWSNTVVLISN